MIPAPPPGLKLHAPGLPSSLKPQPKSQLDQQPALPSTAVGQTQAGAETSAQSAAHIRELERRAAVSAWSTESAQDADLPRQASKSSLDSVLERVGRLSSSQQESEAVQSQEARHQHSVEAAPSSLPHGHSQAGVERPGSCKEASQRPAKEQALRPGEDTLMAEANGNDTANSLQYKMAGLQLERHLQSSAPPADASRSDRHDGSSASHPQPKSKTALNSDLGKQEHPNAGRPEKEAKAPETTLGSRSETDSRERTPLQRGQSNRESKEAPQVMGPPPSRPRSDGVLSSFCHRHFRVLKA